MKALMILDPTDSSTDSNPNGIHAIRRASMMEAPADRESPYVTLSQPNLPTRPICLEDIVDKHTKTNKKKDTVWFSQPTHNEHLIICSELQFTQTPITKVTLRNFSFNFCVFIIFFSG